MHEFYGDNVDTSSKKVLFNKLSCNKANNVLQKILDGNVSDPPNVHLYMHQLDKKGNLNRDKDMFCLCHSTRATNLTKFYHKP